MSGKAKNYEVGRGRPPKHTRWKKGQTGNPKRKRGPKVIDAAAMVEKAFSTKIYVTEQNERRRMSVFEAIILQLLNKASKQDSRAFRVLMQYQGFAIAQSKPDEHRPEVRSYIIDPRENTVREIPV